MSTVNFNDDDFCMEGFGYLLFDADMLCFRLASASMTEVQWDDHTVSAYVDLDSMRKNFEEWVHGIEMDVRTAFDVSPLSILNPIMCFSDASGRNFRKLLYPDYKANRKDKPKPLGYWALADWVKEKYTCAEFANLEADDVIGIISTKFPGNTIMVSGDKDFKSIPGKLYNMLNMSAETITKEQADYFHLYQTLIGDTADNYKGCPGVGPVTAHKVLHDLGATWKTVVDMFALKGISAVDALVQARVAYILRDGDYNFNTKNVKLWTPEN